ncbi:MAG TPA: APC family permease [Thermoanaerobaculia bacterium]|nr:APC family permease [Thermoanaerobaculia bacterium]
MLGPARGRLLTVLGLTFGLAVTIGNTIGAGILRTPGEIAARLPTFWPFMAVWIIGGCYALLGANALAELGTLVPRSGGQYVFVRHALGDYAGFIVGWSDWISTCGTTAAVSIVIGEYALHLVPHLRAVEVVALAVIALITLVQWLGVRWGGWTQDVTSLLKALAFLFLIGACFYLGARNPAGSSIVLEREGSLMLAFVLSLQAVIYTYDGWTAVIYFSEEVKDREKNIPRSMFGGVVSVIVIYILMNIAFLYVVPLPTIAGEKLAAGVVAARLFGPQGDVILRWLTIAALLSAVVSNVLMAPRVLFAMSRDGLFWRGAREVNEGGTPDIALLFSSLMAAAFIVSGRFDQVIAVLTFFFVANYTLSFISLFVLRRREPHASRPFRAWGHPFTTGLALVASVAFLIGAIASDTRNSVYALVVLAISFPVYRLFKRAA